MPVSSTKKILPVCVLIFCIASVPAVFAQNSMSPSMPQISSLDSPEMPSVSTPSLGSGFYRPGNNSNQYYSGPQFVSNSKKTPAEKKEQSDEGNASSRNNLSLTELTSSLSAYDISQLGSLGLLSQLTDSSGLTLGTNTLTNSVSNTLTDTSSVQLKAILSELNSLKQQISSLQDSATLTNFSRSSSSAAIHQEIPKKTNASSLLRFQVNGYDIRKTCRVVYISKIQQDGSFLLTGDRLYESDGHPVSETFYILFRMKGVMNNQKIYELESTVSQSIYNPYSFVYQLSQKNNITAAQTGNLIAIHTNDPAWKLDLLLDLEEN